MPEIGDYWYQEAIKTLMNKCAIALILTSLGKQELLPTITEDILEDAQKMVDEYCVEDS